MNPKSDPNSHLSFNSSLNSTSIPPLAHNPIVILGSSRSDGNTYKAVHAVFKAGRVGKGEVPIIDLSELTIAHYDYHYKNKEDDFLSLAERMVQHNPIILATPVYWYTMSGLMKTFIDRWSDLIDIRKDLGRQLTNKELYVITSYGTTLPSSFEEPFSQTCRYLGIHYKGCLSFFGGNDPQKIKENDLLVERFANQIF